MCVMTITSAVQVDAATVLELDCIRQIHGRLHYVLHIRVNFQVSRRLTGSFSDKL